MQNCPRYAWYQGTIVSIVPQPPTPARCGRSGVAWHNNAICNSPCRATAQALLPVDGASPLLTSASEAQTVKQPGAMLPTPPTGAPLSMSQPSMPASDPGLQPPAPPPLQPGEPAHDGAADSFAAAGAALPALHMGFASPPLPGREVPVVTTAETPTTTMIDSWLVDTPTQPERNSQGELILSLPLPSQQEL